MTTDEVIEELAAKVIAKHKPIGAGCTCGVGGGSIAMHIAKEAISMGRRFDKERERIEHDVLYCANPDCPNPDVQPAPGGGVKCQTCNGWFCF